MTKHTEQLAIARQADTAAAPFDAWGRFLSRLSTELLRDLDTVDIAGQVGRASSRAHSAAADIYLEAEQRMAALDVAEEAEAHRVEHRHTVYVSASGWSCEVCDDDFDFEFWGPEDDAVEPGRLGDQG